MYKRNVADGDVYLDAVGKADSKVLTFAVFFLDGFDAEKFTDSVREVDDKVTGV